MIRNALVLSAGGFWAAWEVGAWSVLRDRFHPDLIVGASAGSWNGWVLASGASPEELTRLWLDPRMAGLIQFGLHRAGFLRGQPLADFSVELHDRFRPRMPFALTLVELPSLRLHLIREHDVTARHLAAACSIPMGFPPVTYSGRTYVDGGFRGALPLWAAEAEGATQVLALNVLNTPEFRLLHRITHGRAKPSRMHVTCVEPSHRLGSLRDALVWNPTNIERWIEQGRSDASSITM